LMTHFANADTPNHPLNQQQLNTFLQLPAVQHTSLRKSLCNSAAIWHYPDAQTDYIRPGLSLYGVSPFLHQTASDLGLKPVMQLTSTITQLYSIPPGEVVGYGSTWQAERQTLVAVVAMGYADGYPRCIEPGTKVYLKGYEAPLIGRVSMDTLTIDVTDIPDVKLGNFVELWGLHIPIERVALAAGTIPYELMSQVNAR
jgi:alanine racemase